MMKFLAVACFVAAAQGAKIRNEGRVEYRVFTTVPITASQTPAATQHGVCSKAHCLHEPRFVFPVALLAMPALSSQHGQGHALLSYVGRTLLRLADEFCLAVITTNFTSKSRIEAECKPSLGISWAGIPSTRVWLRRDHAATASATGGSAGAEASLQITATVVKSNRLETGACTSLRL
eukprot:gene12386-15652_t